MQESYILSIKNLSKSFGSNKVLDSINLNVRPGTVIGLMGENGAGKSTMMKCLFGIYSKDEGKFYLDGKQVDFTSPKEALENGVAMVHQELNQVLDRTVVDNLFLGRFPMRFGVVNENLMKKEAAELFRKLDITVNLDIPMRKMSVATRQMCEIAKAMSYNAKIVVLDEPTSSLSNREVKKLFQIINDLKKDGVSFIYISHKMDEIFQICDDVAVLRDGHMIMSKKVADTNINELITSMVGRSLSKRYPEVDNNPSSEDILVVNDLSTKYAPYLKNISFNVKKGEIFGFYGLIGAGRSELLETLFGVRVRASGTIRYKDNLVNFKSSSEAMREGLAMITEERKFNGMFPMANLTFNTCICNLDNYKKFGVLSTSLMNKAANREIIKMHTKCNGYNDLISSLSGGNQQKVIIGKWLERKPDLLLLDDPTRGIDVGAKYEIYQLIIQMAKKGTSVIVVSSEMPEILGITNRIAVLSNGRLAGIVNTKETNQDELLRLSTKYL